MTMNQIYLTEIINAPVLSKSKRQVGKILDFILALNNGKAVLTGAVIFDFNTSQKKLALKDDFLSFSPDSFVLSNPIANLPLYPSVSQTTATQLWDKSVIDTTNIRAVQINDLSLKYSTNNIWIDAVSISFIGILRRLGLHNTLGKVLQKVGICSKDELIGWDKIKGLSEQFTSITSKMTSDYFQNLHPADLADVLDDLNVNDQISVIESLDDEAAAETIAEAESETQVQIIEKLDTESASDIIEEMDPDEAADLLQDMDSKKANEILAHMDLDEASDVRKLLKFEEDTAGGLMTTEYAAIYEDFTVKDAFSHLRLVAADIEIIYYMYVIDKDEQLKGVVSIRDLLAANPSAKVADVMDTDLVTVSPDTPQEDVAALISKYDLVGIPVVDKQNEILGVVTIDDIVDVMEEEASEDIFKLAGSSEDELSYTSPLQACKARLPWLLVTLGTGFITSSILKHFMADFHQILALIFFVPVVCAMGGNAGIQSSTLVIRGLALNTFSKGDFFRRLVREVVSGALMGVVCGLVVGTWAMALVKNGNTVAGAVSPGYLSLTIGMAMMSAMTFASLFGSLIPLIFDHFKIDPAVASGPFVTSSNDIFALLIYYSVAMVMLS